MQLIDWIGTQVTDLIRGLEDDKTQQLSVAILLVLWVSAIASSFIDNIPYTTAMVNVTSARFTETLSVQMTNFHESR